MDPAVEPLRPSPSATTSPRRRYEEAHAVRMNVLGSGMQEARDGAATARLVIWVTTVVNLPQILIAIVLMVLHWKPATLCYRVQMWVLFQTIHLSIMLALEWATYYLNQEHRSNRVLHFRERYMRALNQAKYMMDLMGIFWFLVGNMWIINDSARCDDGSTMYHLALAMMLMLYVKIFLPCILLLAMLPVICFCLPCVIRLLNRLQDPMRGRGAPVDVINHLPLEKYRTGMFPEEDSSCCICLNEYEPSQELRVLPRCSHHFHRECVDEWLVVNATCPTCRTSVNERSDHDNNRSEYYGTEAQVMAAV